MVKIVTAYLNVCTHNVFIVYFSCWVSMVLRVKKTVNSTAPRSAGPVTYTCSLRCNKTGHLWSIIT